MKNISKLFVELIFTLIVAGILSTLLSLLLWFISTNLDIMAEARTYIDFVSGILFGLIVGFKLKTLLIEDNGHGKSKKK